MIVSGTAGARLTPQLNGRGGARLTPQLNGKGGSPLANDRVLPLSPLKCGTWMVVSKTIVDPRKVVGSTTDEKREKQPNNNSI